MNINTPKQIQMGGFYSLLASVCQKKYGSTTKNLFHDSRQDRKGN